MIGLQSLADSLLQYGFTNLCVAGVLGILAWVVQTSGQRAFLAHMLWLLVLLKLVTPPLVPLSVVSLPDFGSPTGLATQVPTVVFGTAELNPTTALLDWKMGLAALWLLGSALILAWSLAHIVRFNRLLRAASTFAAPALQNVAAETALRLGLKSNPAILMTSANISPMVWWTGGRVRIFIPTALADRMDPAQLRWILAHELGHVRRRDHLVRWLEWLVCVCFWWNPVAWWARRNLRINEEVCCDALVLSTLTPRAHTYASALVTVLEILTAPAIRPPAMASEINGGGFMERRIKMIVSKQSISLMPRWLRNSVLLCAAVLLPLGFSLSQETGDYERVAEWLEAGVNSAYLTQEQADIMLNALRHAGANAIFLRPVAGAKAQLAEAIVAIEQQFELGQITKEQAEIQRQELHARFEREPVGIAASMINMDGPKLALFEQAMADIARRFEAGLISGQQAEQEARQQAEALGITEEGGLRFIWKDIVTDVVNAPRPDAQDLQ